MVEFLYGRQAVRESLRAGRRHPQRLVLAEGLKATPVLDEIVELAQRQHLRTAQVPRSEIDRFADVAAHQGVVLETSVYPYSTLEDVLGHAERRHEPPLLLLLDLVQDVHNLGSLIRTAEAAGVHGMVIQERRAAGITPAAVNASSGAVEHLRVAQVTNLAHTLNELKDRGCWIAGLEGAPDAQPYTDVDLTGALGIVVGSEGSGLRRLVHERCDWIIAIPMRGQVESLNASVAGSLVIYEALRQRTLLESRPAMD